MQLFQHPVTRNFDWRYFNHIAIVFGTIWLAFITVVAVIAQAYELIQFTTTSYNETYVLWYEKVTLPSWRPPSTCYGSIIPLGTGRTSVACGLI